MTLELDYHDTLLLKEIIGNILWQTTEDEDGGYFSDPAFNLSKQEYETLNEIKDKL